MPRGGNPHTAIVITKQSPHVAKIAVDAQYRRCHIDERLFVALIDEAMKRGARWIILDVRKSNLRAQALYRKYRFKDVGVRKGYYSGETTRMRLSGGAETSGRSPQYPSANALPFQHLLRTVSWPHWTFIAGDPHS